MLLNAQKQGIKGIVTDANNQPLELVSVAALRIKDSSFVSFTTTDAKGNFYLTGFATDSLRIQFNLLGFTTYTKKVAYKNQLIDLATIVLQEEVNALNEIVIAAVVPIQVKKDTISYNAAAFKVGYDDTIESLLKKLPGIEIESGKVIAQGNNITKIMIDGKEFFGGDPSIVLKNIPADAIAKVEIIDKKSDQEELTGVNDGTKEVIINLTLKKATKNRGFGKASVGIGLDQRYFTNANYNQFNKKTQVSIIGRFNNINVTGSNIQEFLQNADGLADDADDESQNTPTNKSLSGFLNTKATGVHYGTELKPKVAVNADYFYNSLTNNGISVTNRQSFTNTNNFNFVATNNFVTTNTSNNANFNYEDKATKSQILRFKGRFLSDNSTNYLDRDGDFFNAQDEKVTTNKTLSQIENQRYLVNLNMNFVKRLPKKGRVFILTANGNFTDVANSNSQDNTIFRNLNSNNPRNQTLFTTQDRATTSSNFLVRFKFTEPIAGHHFINTEASTTFYSFTEQTSQNRTIVEANIQKDSLQFAYDFDQLSANTKLFYSYQTPKFTLETGVESQYLRRNFGQVGVSLFSKNQVFANPFTVVQYTPKRGEKFRFTYRRFIKAPAAYQTNPFVNDINPYFINTGNVDLLPEKAHAFVSFYNVTNLQTNANFNAKVEYTFATDAIIRALTIDDAFVRTSSFQNNGNKQDLLAEANFSSKFSSIGVLFNVKNSFQFSSVNTIVNFAVNQLTSKEHTTKLILQNLKKKNIDAKLGYTHTQNSAVFSIENNLNRTFTNQTYFGLIDVAISPKLNVNTQIDFIQYRDTNFTMNQNVVLWNASASYALVKNNHIFKLLLIDMLNQNVDIFRRSTANFFEETTAQSLQRYVVLSYTFRLQGNQPKT